MREPKEYHEELELIFEQASEEMPELPAGLRERARELLALSHPQKPEASL